MIAQRPKKIPSGTSRSFVALNSALGTHGMTLIDKKGRILSWNATSEKLTGYSAKDIVGRNYSVLFSRESRKKNEPEKAILTAAREDRVIEEGVRVRKNGTRIFVRSFLALVSDAAKNQTFFILTMQDITREKADQNERDEYIGMASHELRNPIATLSLYSELLGIGLSHDRDKKNLDMLREMQNQTARLVTLVDDLLIVGKIEGDTLVLHKEIFNINHLIRDTIRNFQLLTVTHKILLKGIAHSKVSADRNRIAQVLINLITNAVKYSPYADKVFVRVGKQRSKCVVSVQDFGHGIAKKEQAKVFNRFYRTREAEIDDRKGSGLGLYISREIIKKHHERLWLKSRKGKGTTFFFTLPRA